MSSNSLYDKLLEYKEKGNKEFLRKDNGLLSKNRAIAYYQIAIKLFNETSNKVEDKELDTQINKLMGIIYSNLSLIYLNSYEIKKALQVTENGIKIDPISNSKLYYRNSLANRYLSNFQESINSLEKSILIENSNSSMKLNFINEKKQLELKIEKLKKEEIEFKKQPHQEKLQKQQQQFPNVRIEWKAQGRVTLANKDLEKGAVLFRVEPFVSTLEDSNDMKLKYCGFCLQKVEKSKRKQFNCKNCKLHLICEGCRELKDNIAVTHHGEHCDIFKYLNDNFPNSESRDFRLMIKVLSSIVNGRKGIITTINTASRSNLPYISNDYNDFINLTRGTTIDKIEGEHLKRFKRGAESLFNLISDVRGDKFFTDVNLKLNGIVDIYSIIMTNAHSIPTILRDKEIGSGVFPSGCYFNHSCMPNACWWLDNEGMMVFTTIKPVKKDEELVLCYLDNSKTVTTRRKHLLTQYGFLCNCELCEFQSNLTGLRCKNCCSGSSKGSNEDDAKQQFLYKSSIEYHEPLNKNDPGIAFICEVCKNKRNYIQEEASKNMGDLQMPEELQCEDTLYLEDERTFPLISMASMLYNYQKDFNTTHGISGISGIPPELKDIIKKESDLIKDVISCSNYSLKRLSDSNIKGVILATTSSPYYYRLFKAIKSDSPSDKQELLNVKKHVINNLDKNNYLLFKNYIDKKFEI